jgi:hypothetical protein
MLTKAVATSVAMRTRFVRTDVYELASERIPDRLPSDWPQVRRPEFESCGGITLPRQ